MAAGGRESTLPHQGLERRELLAAQNVNVTSQAGATPEMPRSLLTRMAQNMSSCLFLRWRRLGVEMRAFARELENVVFPAVRAAGSAEAVILITLRHGKAQPTMLGSPTNELYAQLRQLPTFLSDIGIRTILCDADLESNQIYDILETLWCARRAFKKHEGRPLNRLLGSGKIYAALTSKAGLHMSCARLTLDPRRGRLVIRNSYCQLLFSRLVSAYKRKASLLKDHRAFFRAAPRYAWLMAGIVVLPVFLHVVVEASTTVLVVSSFALAALVGLSTYFVFQTVAAQEYDKEHQARELERRHNALSRIYDKIQLDLQGARDVQRMLLPPPDMQPFPERLHFASSFIPETDVGGDYYDMKRLDDHRVAILLADVSGHGMSAAFVTGLVKTAFEYGQLEKRNTSDFMGELNRLLGRLIPDSHFAAVVYAIFDTESHVLKYCNAGHGPVPIIIRGSTGRIEELNSPVEMVAGVDADTAYEEGVTTLAPGDKLVLCTDGITESTNLEEERFGLQRLYQVLREHCAESSDRLRLEILKALANHTDGMPQHDDQTLLIIDVLK